VQAQPHTSFAKILMCAALAMFVAAPATFADSGPTAPVFPSAVPSHPGALTGTDGASDAARAQERYYSSYGDPAPLNPVSTPVDDGGVDWASIGIVLGGICLLAGTVTVLVVRTRRRTGRVRVAA
jgi:hypothetical protein